MPPAHSRNAYPLTVVARENSASLPTDTAFVLGPSGFAQYVPMRKRSLCTQSVSVLTRLSQSSQHTFLLL